MPVKKSVKKKKAAPPARKKVSARKKSRHTRRKARSVDSELSTLEKKVKKKEHSLSRARARAHQRQAAQRDADATIRRLTSERDSLVDTLAVISGRRKMAQDERDAATRDVKDAEADLAALRRRIKKHESFDAVSKAIDEVDGGIDRLR